MISGNTLIPRFWQSIAASMIARTCISRISGYVIAQAASAMTQHRVRFVQLLHATRHGLGRDPDFLRQLPLLRRIVRHEFVQRRIDQPDGHRKSVHGLENPDEVAPLEWQQLVERLAARLGVSARIIS